MNNFKSNLIKKLFGKKNTKYLRISSDCLIQSRSIAQMADINQIKSLFSSVFRKHSRD
jgi:hypothetical protein